MSSNIGVVDSDGEKVYRVALFFRVNFHEVPSHCAHSHCALFAPILTVLILIVLSLHPCTVSHDVSQVLTGKDKWLKALARLSATIRSSGDY